MSQFSLFGAAAADPSRADLDGLLLAGGQWVQHGDRARLSVVVADRWRADALLGHFAALGLTGSPADGKPADGNPDEYEPVVPAGDGWSVRTAFTAGLTGSAAGWRRGATLGPPPGFALGPGGLRCWTVAAGRHDDAGYLLGTPGAHTALHLVAGAQLSRHGLAAVSLSQRPGPGWRLTGAKRVRRLAELVGPPPSGADTDWPSAGNA